MSYKLIQGDCLEVMRTFPDNEFSTVITDAPYGLGKQLDTIKLLQHWMNDQEYKNSNGFMNKDWDVLPGPAIWKEVYRVLKPGGFCLVFAGTRTYDLMTLAIRLAGFEIRDCVMFLYGSGFPKSHNISVAIDQHLGAKREVIGKYTSVPGLSANKGWNTGPFTRGEVGDITAPATDAAQAFHGYGTALKPAWDPIIVAMKPLEGTYAQNALAYGVAGLNIDGCRIESTDFEPKERLGATKLMEERPWNRKQLQGERKTITVGHNLGRWPANLVLDEVTEQLLDEQSGELTSGIGSVKRACSAGHQGNVYGKESRPAGTPSIEYGDTGGASRFFYTAKASSSERNEGLDGIEAHQRDASRNADQPSMNGGEGNPFNRGAVQVRNSHPTVKPLSLMRWLVRLTRTPKGGVVLDPFSGSGSTGVACLLEDRDAVLIEREPEYVTIARHRLEHWQDEADVKPRKIKGRDSDYADSPLFAEVAA